MEDKTYFSYLLRMWRILRGNELVWLASLDDPHTGKRHSFTSLEKLFAFLLKQTQAANHPLEKQSDQDPLADEEEPSDGTPQP